MSGTESTEENIDELKETKEVDEDSDMAEGGNTSFSGKNMEAHKSRGLNGKLPSSRQSTLMDKKTQQMLAELYRLKAQMSETQHSIHRPPIRPYTPNIFNSLSPYYNQYMVNYTIQDLQQGIPVTRGYHHRSTALGVVDPEISWRMDTFPAPFHQSRQLSKLFHSITWSRNMQQSDIQGSTRLPPLPMPGFPKFNQPSYQPHQMTYDQLASFRGDLRSVHGRLAEQQAKTDYERTVQDWKRMNLSELKKLAPDRRHHVKKAIMSYMGTSRGSSRALKPLAKELETTTTETVMQQ